MNLEKIDWRLGTVHDLRASFATHAARRGVRMHELKELLGHSSITVTEQFYLDVGDDVAERVRAAFTA